MATTQEVQDLREKMTAERERLLSVLQELGEEDAERSTSGEGEWSAKQQMAHLCEMESAYRAWVEKALAEDDADVDGLVGERPAIRLEAAQAHSVAEHLAEMRRQRALTDAMIDGMTLEDYARTARQSMFGRLTLLQWLRSYYRHDRMHHDQVQGRDPEYKPRFTGAEPDQRRA
jgi:hypothetical protein